MQLSASVKKAIRRGKTPETILKEQIRDYLMLKRIFNVPLTQGIASHRGSPDRLVFHNGKIYCLEIKAPDGRLSERQCQFRDDVEVSGNTYIVARCLEDVIAYF